MGINPQFVITADDANITNLLAPRLISLRLHDEAGSKSDTLEIELADDGIAIPPTGAKLRCWIGYDGSASDMGLFIVDEIEVSGPPDRMVIRGKAAPLDIVGHMQTQKSRSWDDGTLLGDLVKRIAADHGLIPKISDALAAIVLPHIDQTKESDINLVTRIAREYDAVAKPAGGYLVVVGRGTSNISGITISPDMISGWSVTINKRDPSGTVIATWYDVSTATTAEISAGSGEPIKRIKNHYPSQAAASAAVKAAYKRGNRASKSLSLSLPGDTRFIAEGKLLLVGFKEVVDGEWLISSVDHEVSSAGYRCSISAQAE